MPRLHETIETSLPLQDTFAYIADFATNEEWDPNTVSAVRVGDGPVGTGARYDLVVKMGSGTIPMQYTIEAYEPDRRVVLRGVGKDIVATDDIRFAPTDDGGTRVDYLADIELKGWKGLLTPFLGGAFRKIGQGARDGMTEALAERARTTAR